MFRVITITLIALTLSGCPTIDTQYPMRTETIKANGSYSHGSSGMMFPVVVGDFARGSITRFDAEGLNVGVGYDLYQMPKVVAATIYVYPSPSIVSVGSPANVIESARATLCQNEYDARKREIVSAHPGARLLNESVLASPREGVSSAGKTALFEYEEVFVGLRQSLHSRLDIFCYIDEKWTVKYRFTYPAESDVKQDLANFIKTAPWP